MTIETPKLKLVLESLDTALRGVADMPEEHRQQLSAEWLKQLEAANEGDFWILGFRIVCRESETTIGQCGYKGPPSDEGSVEISYYIYEEQEGNGYATEAAHAITQNALQHTEVNLVIAHTLPENNASTRVLTKCGFKNVGEVEDPEDGRVWRWEIPKTASSESEHPWP